ncbi:hypothetical protein FQN54_009144 [Arachnomyces sp. PD_36]|nr:hypothetical protein FQN54_009144 [Arachnomyces sp. PD_36]
MSSGSRTNITKRACDGCKIRKIKCGGNQPCRACIHTGIACTYVKTPLARGRQRMRVSTRQIIEQTQRQHGYQQPESNPANPASEASRTSATPENEGASGGTQQPTETVATPKNTRIATDTLALQLYIYHVRMFPVWPIVRVEDTVAALQRDEEGTDAETYALATAIAAATMAQLRLGESPSMNSTVMAAEMEAECQRARASFNYKQRVSLNNLRTSFFLHIYHEDQHTGGSESLLYLREAISMAQMMYLHRENSYLNVSAEEQQLRRRILWLLFVTERGVCVLHKFPVAIKTNIALPVIDRNDESHVLPGFLNLVNLFCTFDQSGMFNIDPDQDTETPAVLGGVSFDIQFLEMLQKKLQEAPTEQEAVEDVQKADICVTRHWMRMILWKLYSKSDPLALPSSGQVMSQAFPVVVAREFLHIISKLPNSAIEAHGFGMELKIYEIASSVADAISKLALLPRALSWSNEDRPSNILTRLHLILSSFRGGGNKTLVDMLYKKMAQAQTRAGPTLPRQPSALEGGDASQSRPGHMRVVEYNDDDGEGQARTRAPFPNSITSPGPITSTSNNTVSRENEPTTSRNTTGYPNLTRPRYYDQSGNLTSGQQQPLTANYQFAAADVSMPVTSSQSSASSQTSNANNNIPSIQQFTQQQQSLYDISEDLMLQAPYQQSPLPRPISSSSLSIQMQMMAEDIIQQQAQTSQSFNPLATGFGNVFFSTGGTGVGNDEFRGSILGEDYSINDT